MKSAHQRAKRTKKRLELLDYYCDVIRSQDIFGPLNPKKKREIDIKTLMYNVLLEGTRDYYASRLTRKSAIENNAQASLVWEGHQKERIYPPQFFGVTHRPDYLLLMHDLRIALEIKIADDGASIREAIGQGLVYSTEYDFVVLLLIDISDDNSISNHFYDPEVVRLLSSIWAAHNIRIEVV